MAWAPYFEKMTLQISQLGASEIKNWQGRKISDVLNLSFSGCSGNIYYGRGSCMEFLRRETR